MSVCRYAILMLVATAPRMALAQTVITVPGTTETLRDALFGVQAGDTIEIQSDTWISEADGLPVITVPLTIRSTAGADATAPLPALYFDLTGYSGAAPAVVTLQGLRVEEGLVEGIDDPVGALVKLGGDLVASDLQLLPTTNDADASAMRLTGGNVTLTKLAIDGFTNPWNAIEADGDSLYDFQITDCSLTNNVRAIRADNFVSGSITDCTFSNDGGMRYGPYGVVELRGGIWTLGDPLGATTVTFSDLQLSSIWAEPGPDHPPMSLDIHHTHFAQATNTADWGGGLVVGGLDTAETTSSCPTVIRDSTFVATEGIRGGAVHFRAEGGLTLEDVTMADVWTHYQGGGVWIDGELTATNVQMTMSDNTFVPIEGGAIYLASGSTATLHDIDASGLRAQNRGGFLAGDYDTTIDITASYLHDLHAVNGGVFSQYGAGRLTAIDTRFEDTSADDGGVYDARDAFDGVAVSFRGTPTVDGDGHVLSSTTTFEGIEAVYGGGIASLSGPSSLELSGFVADDVQATNGGMIRYYDLGDAPDGGTLHASFEIADTWFERVEAVSGGLVFAPNTLGKSTIHLDNLVSTSHETLSIGGLAFANNSQVTVRDSVFGRLATRGGPGAVLFQDPYAPGTQILIEDLTVGEMATSAPGALFYGGASDLTLRRVQIGSVTNGGYPFEVSPSNNPGGLVHFASSSDNGAGSFHAEDLQIDHLNSGPGGLVYASRRVGFSLERATLSDFHMNGAGALFVTTYGRSSALVSQVVLTDSLAQGYGALIVSYNPLDVEVRDSLFTDVGSASAGGMLYIAGGPNRLVIRDSDFVRPTGSSSGTVLQSSGYNFILIDGVTVAGINDSYGAAITASTGDELVVRNSRFIDLHAVYNAPAISTYEASRVDVSCTSFCNNSSGSGAGAIDVQASQGNQTRLQNNVFVNNDPAGSGYGALRLDLYAGFGEVANNTFLNDFGAGTTTADQAIGLSSGGSGASLLVTNNIFEGHSLAVTLSDRSADVRNNLWWDNDSDREPTNHPSDPSPLFAQPVYDGFDFADCTTRPYLAVGSPGVDQGSPALLDWDGSPADVGAFGGPDADLCIPDVDLDGWPETHDCNDLDPRVHPMALEVPYDGIDQDCDQADACDLDNDGALATLCGGTDCDDTDPSRPTVEVAYDGVDQDCDGYDLCDVDRDGFVGAACGGPDCDDGLDTVHPGAADACYDGVDQDCDGWDDWDCDRDGHVKAGLTDYPGSGITDDCDDDDASIYTGATDVPYDGIDQDCSGADSCDADEDGYDSLYCGGDDCDDRDATIHPGAAETTYDGVDQDCDGYDECDGDSDGHSSPRCGGSDCDDADASIHPGAAEVAYDEVDQDCNGHDLCDADHDGFDAIDCGGSDCDDSAPGTWPGAAEIPNDGIDQSCSGSDHEILGETGCSTTGSSGMGGLGILLAFAATLRRRRGGVAALALATPSLAGAATLAVPGTYPTVSDALLVAVDGDEIVIDGATYTGEVADVPVITTQVTIRSEGGSASMAVPLRPLAINADVVLEGLSLEGGTVDLDGQISTGGLFAIDALVIGTDLRLRPGASYVGGPGIQGIRSTFDLEGLDVQDFPGTAPAIKVEGTDSQAVAFSLKGSQDLPCTLSGNGDVVEGNLAALDASLAAVTVEGCTFQDNHSSAAIVQISDGTATVRDTTFHGNEGTALAYVAEATPRDNALHVIDSTFTANTLGGLAGAITTQDRGSGGVLWTFIDGCTFANNQGSAGGDLFFDAKGSLEVTHSTFTDSYASTGGAILTLGRTTISDSTFVGSGHGVDTPTGGGGAIFLQRGPLEVYRTSFSDVTAGAGAVLQSYGTSSPARVRFEDVTVDGALAQFTAGIADLTYTHMTIDRMTASNVTGNMGGAFRMQSNDYGVLTSSLNISDSVFDEIHAKGADTVSQMDVGGLVMAMGPSSVGIYDTRITNTSAANGGGVLLLSNGSASPSVDYCPSPSNLGPGTRNRSTIVLEGVDQSGSTAAFGAVLAVQPQVLAESVRVHGSSFSGNRSESGPSFSISKTQSLDFTCNEVCGDSGADTLVLGIYDHAFYDLAGEYTVENNVFQGAIDLGSASALLDLRLCDRGSGAPYYEGPGQAVIGNNTFLDNEGAEVTRLHHTLYLGSGQPGVYTATALRNNLIDGALDAHGLYGDPVSIDVGTNLYDNLDGLVWSAGSASADPGTQLFETPLYTSLEPDTCASQLWLDEGSPGRDALVDLAFTDTDGSAGDLGAYGGPGACFPDRDRDGEDARTDCEDDDDTIGGAITEIPYDGIDQNCDGHDACDLDGDGFASTACPDGTDCNDANPAVNPGRADIPYDGLDQDCTGLDQCDVDADQALATECGGDDCNDYVDSIYAGAVEVPYDGIDQDCDGSDLCDVDGDLALAYACGGDDCDDSDPQAYPGAPEVPYDGIDQDCDLVDGCDADEDGFWSTLCGGPDCNDLDDTISPVATDIPYDGIDQDCSGADLSDADRDGQPPTSLGGTDCDDADPTIYAGAREIPYDDIDQDCDGSDLCDGDSDGFVAEACGGDDCDDANASIHVGAPEKPFDGIDQDCDTFDGSDLNVAASGCSTVGGGSGLVWLAGLLGALLRRRKAAAALLVAGAAVSTPASAQDLVLGLTCEDYLGSVMTGPTSLTWDNANTLTCTIQYSNASGTTLSNVKLQLEADKLVVNDVAPSLPDGVEGITTPQTFSMIQSTGNLSGNPSVSFSFVNQTATLTLGTVPQLATSEASFQINPMGFPISTTEWTLRALIGNVADTEGEVTFQTTWAPRHDEAQVEPIEVVDPSRRYIGTAFLNRSISSAAHIDAAYVLYLPYYDQGTGTYVADGAFDANDGDLPVVDPDQLRLQLLARDGVDTTVRNYEMPEGTLTWAGASNPGALIHFDPDTQTVVARPGVISDSERRITQWRLRWDGGFSAGHGLVDGNQIPVQFCFQSAAWGGSTPGGPTCASNTSTVGEESLFLSVGNYGCPGSSITVCNSESRPFAVGGTGSTRVYFGNETSLTTDMDVYVQLPGAAENGGKAATLDDIQVTLSGTGPFRYQAASDVTLYISTDPADYDGASGGTDVLGRTLPAPGTSWLECVGSRGSDGRITWYANDLDVQLAMIGQTRADVEQVYVKVTDMVPHWMADLDRSSGSGFSTTSDVSWLLDLQWTMDDTVNGTIQGSTSLPGPNTGISDFDHTTTENAAFGTLGRLHPASIVQDDLYESFVAEVTAQSFTWRCGINTGSSRPTSHQFYSNSCQGPNFGVADLNTSAMNTHSFSFGVKNSGTIDNVRGPFEFCTAIPLGVRFENNVTADPMMPVMVLGTGSASGSGADLVDPSEYSYTWSPPEPGDAPEIAGRYCVSVPSPSRILEVDDILNAHVQFRVVPGITDGVRFSPNNSSSGGQGTAQGQGADGTPRVQHFSFWGTRINVTGKRAIHVTNTIDPSVTIGNRTEVCYDYELDVHAFLDQATPVLDPQGATLPVDNAVSYQWIPNASYAQPDTAEGVNTASTTYASSVSPDSLRIYISTSNAPLRVPANQIQSQADWILCTETPDGVAPAPDCDAAAIVAAGVASPDDVRWVAFEFGLLAITDAEPRGVAPFDGATRVNNPYYAQLCVAETGASPDGSTLASVLETVSDLLTVVAQPLSIDIDSDCPEGGWATPELCNGADEDCDGVDDNGFFLGSDCIVGKGVCENTGVLQCSDDELSSVCSVEPLDVASEELCDGLDNNCDGNEDEPFAFPNASPFLDEVCFAGQGVCMGVGQYVCTQDGSGIECTAQADPTQAGAENCDANVDNDCDGDPLNGFDDLGETCSVGTGACEVQGYWYCAQDASGLLCDANEGAAITESCNGEDSDCDGHIDATEVDGQVISHCDDSDDDGIVDWTEFAVTGTDRDNPDTDGDGLQDGTELGLTVPESADATDAEVFIPDADPTTTSDPLDCDGDDDGLLDGTEDTDFDGLVDAEESDPLDADTDHDGVLDGTEVGLAAPEGECTDLDVLAFTADVDPDTTTLPWDPDTDGDGLPDGVEDANADGSTSADETDPADDDSDDDGLLDGTEDRNANGRVDVGETSPLDDDSDDDGVQDGTESGVTTPEGDGTDPANFVPDADPTTTTRANVRDTDNGSLIDGAEDTNFNGLHEPDLGECDPTDPSDDRFCTDADSDGLSDGHEISLGLDPYDDDTDDDGILDVNEVNDGTDPLDPDSDNDGLFDGTEIGLTAPQGLGTNTALGVFVADTDPATTTDPLDDDTDDDCLIDGNEDANHDGSQGSGETSPIDGDSDDDALSDGTEGGLSAPQGTGTQGDACQSAHTNQRTDPLDNDSDGDGLADGVEDANHDGLLDPGETDPSRADTDGGGVSDSDELAAGTDPRDRSDDVPTDQTFPEPEASCGCVSGVGPGVPWWLLGLAVLGARRRRAKVLERKA